MKSTKTLVGAFALALLALAIAPGLATAQNAVLYEVTENMKLKKNDGRIQRGATAALMGWISPGTSLCPAWLVEKLVEPGCAITALASNNINVATGKGPVSGTFKVVIQGDNPVDGPELVILNGKLHGHMNLAPAILQGVPLGFLEAGHWSVTGERGGPLDGLRTGGTLTGTFRLPFVFGVPDGCLAKNPAECLFISKPSYVVNGGPVELQAYEYSLGVPTVQLEVTFVERAQHSDDD